MTTEDPLFLASLTGVIFVGIVCGFIWGRLSARLAIPELFRLLTTPLWTGAVALIFDPKLRTHLADTRAWPDIKDLPFMLKPAWVRHDEHYHVDFEVTCQPLRRD